MSGRIVCIFLWLQIISVLSIRIPVSRMKRAVEDPNELEYKLPINFGGTHYGGKVNVGSPARVFNVVFDTGSVASWFASSRCRKCVQYSNGNNTFYDGTQSSSFKQGKTEAWDLNYQDGSTVKGTTAVYDHIKIGSGPDALVVKHQGFGEVEDYEDPGTSTDALLDGMDGIIGLGLVSVAQLPGDPDPLFYSLVKQNNIQPVFGLHLTNKGSVYPTAELVFGGHDEDLVETAFSHHPVLKKSRKYLGWLIELNGVKVAGNVMVQGPIEATIDTGATAIHGSVNVMNHINQFIFQSANFPFTNDYFFMCGTDLSSLPDVTLTLGNQDFLLKPTDYTRITTGGTCRTRFIGMSNIPDNEFILGTVFMETFYPRFNFGEQRVEFARLKKYNA